MIKFFIITYPLFLLFANSDFSIKNIDKSYFSQYFMKDTIVTLSKGIEYREWFPPSKSTLTETYPLVILKVDQKHNQFDLSLGNHHTGKEWLDEKDLSIAVNAGMFTPNGLPNGFTMKSGEIIQEHHPNAYNHYISIDSTGLLKVYDPECDNLSGTWYTVTQTIRMFRCDNKVVWSKQPDKQWSTTCIGVDVNNNIYFIHSRSAFMVNSLVHFIKKAVPDIKTISYLEGGPESTLSIKVGSFEKHFCGSYESDFWEDDSNQDQWRIPNFIGVF